MPVKEFASKEQFDALLPSGKVIFIDFYADWCGPCKTISPVFDSLARENAATEGAEFYRLNVDDHLGIAQVFQILAVPTFHVYKSNERIDMLVGANHTALTALVRTGLTRV